MNGPLIFISLTHSQPDDTKGLQNNGKPGRAKQLKDHAQYVPENKNRVKYVIKTMDQQKRADSISHKAMVNESVTTSLDIHIKGLLSVPPKSKSKKESSDD